MSHNDFESPVFERHPMLSELAARAAEATHGICRMSGSGSTLFAFPSGQEVLPSAFAGVLTVETFTATGVASVEEL
jgi:4-diphosphocytidyl-2C-methyl-D-erythritol kinase